MKESLCCAFVLAFVLFVPSAEAARPGQGFLFALNSTEIHGDWSDYGLDGSGSGFSIGAFRRIRLSGDASVQVEGLLTRRTVTGESLGCDLEVQVDSLDIPVLMRYAAGDISVMAGLVFSMNVASNGTAGSGWFQTAVQNSLDDELDDLASTELGMVLGVGVEVYTGSGRLAIDLRYTNGISDIDDGSGTSTTSTLALALGWAF
jgi:hypothetical protein